MLVKFQTVITIAGLCCVHCPFETGESDYDFRLKDWIFDQRDKQSYVIPFRCLYSTNIDNLIMAGKHISVSHVAASATKLMGNGAQHGVVARIAAGMRLAKDVASSDLYERHLPEVRA